MLSTEFWGLCWENRYLDHFQPSRLSWALWAFWVTLVHKYTDKALKIKFNISIFCKTRNYVSGLDPGDRQVLEYKYSGCDPPCLLDSSDGRWEMLTFVVGNICCVCLCLCLWVLSEEAFVPTTSNAWALQLSIRLIRYLFQLRLKLWVCVEKVGW